MSTKDDHPWRQPFSPNAFNARRKHRTISDELAEEQLEREATQERVHSGDSDPSLFELRRDYIQIGDGSGRRGPVYYE